MTSFPRWCASLAIIAVSTTACHDTITDPSIRQPLTASLDRAKEGPTFEWSVPARFGIDANHDGLTDYPRTPAEINPATWTVNFDACGLPTAQKYVWHVDNREVASVTSCNFSYDFPAEGTYDVAVHLIVAPGPGMWAEQNVTVQDWLVVSFGDSYASGEGVPDIAQGSEALIASITAALRSLDEAGQHLEAVKRNLHDAVERKGLADAILNDARHTRDQFLDACHIDSFKSIAECADFLAGLPYETYENARDHFNLAVSNAEERVASALAAVQEAQAAVDSAIETVDNLKAAIAQLQAGLAPPRWQPSGKADAERWGGTDCHRSANAAPARAALELENSDPHTSVTFVHLACSGAQIRSGSGNIQQHQIVTARALLGSREIDAVLLSIGGNDAGFASIATACAVQKPCYVATPAIDPAAAEPVCTLLDVLGFKSQCEDLFSNFPDQSASELLAAGVGGLPASYAVLANELFPTLAGLLKPQLAGPGHDGHGRPGPQSEAAERMRSSRVYISEYVDMTRDATGAYCQFDPLNLLATMPGISPDEMEWLDVGAGETINHAVADAAAAHGWTLVTHIYDNYSPHGYCAASHWVNQIVESLLIQGDVNGLVHPNNFGQVSSGHTIYSTLLQDLYPDGLAALPRAPDPVTMPAQAKGD